MAKRKLSDLELIGMLRQRIVDLETDNINLREKIYDLSKELGNAYASRQLCPVDSVAASQLKNARSREYHG
jgi:hypothetical protein